MTDQSQQAKGRMEASYPKKAYKVTYTNLDGVKDCWTFCDDARHAALWENNLTRAGYTDIVVHTPSEAPNAE